MHQPLGGSSTAVVRIMRRGGRIVARIAAAAALATPVDGMLAIATRKRVVAPAVTPRWPEQRQPLPSAGRERELPRRREAPTRPLAESIRIARADEIDWM